MTIITGSTQKIQQGSAIFQYLAAITGKTPMFNKTEVEFLPFIDKLTHKSVMVYEIGPLHIVSN